MNVPYEVLTKYCYFVANPSFKMAASGGLSLTSNCRTLWEMYTNDFYFRTNEWNETKHGMNIPYEVLTKSCYFVADPLSKMAASRGT